MLLVMKHKVTKVQVREQAEEREGGLHSNYLIFSENLVYSRSRTIPLFPFFILV